MTEEQTISWIFLSIALASQTEPTDFNGISSIADGINHAVPTNKELHTAISWLTRLGFVENIGKKYALTESGRRQYDQASKDSNLLHDIWRQLENNLTIRRN